MKRFTTAAVIILLAFLAGCGKDNPVKPTLPPPPKYLPLSTPLNTLENLRRAYTTRDSTEYDSLFDKTYTGTSIDQTDPRPGPLHFTWSDEARHINALARASSIGSITLEFPPNLMRGRDLADPPGWALVQASGTHLEIVDAVLNTTLVISPSELMEFRFAPTSPSLGSPTDTTWHIVRWTEVRN